MSNRYDATQKLISIFDDAGVGSNTALAAVEALGRAGGHDALVKLIEIHDKAGIGSNTRLVAVKALGELGRVN